MLTIQNTPDKFRNTAAVLDPLHDDSHIETVNFEPTREFLCATNQMLREVLWQAPSDAVLKVRFKQVARGFVGLLYVSGLQKQFVSSVREHELAKLPEILGKKMADRLLAWKKTRVFV